MFQSSKTQDTGSRPRVCDLVGLRWGQEFAILTSDQVIRMLLVCIPHFENNSRGLNPWPGFWWWWSHVLVWAVGSGRHLTLDTHSEVQAGWAWPAVVVMESQSCKWCMLGGLTPLKRIHVDEIEGLEVAAGADRHVVNALGLLETELTDWSFFHLFSRASVGWQSCFTRTGGLHCLTRLVSHSLRALPPPHPTRTFPGSCGTARNPPGTHHDGLF